MAGCILVGTHFYRVISMRLQDDQSCAKCFAEERSASREHRLSNRQIPQSRERSFKEQPFCSSFGMTGSVGKAPRNDR
jgi:hypothetical protein